MAPRPREGVALYRDTLIYQTTGKGLLEVTGEIRGCVRDSGISEGVCYLFLRHTSASLVISENADPSARRDLENFFDRLAPENDPNYTHTSEGPDDMPSHIRAALTRTSETILVEGGAPLLGTWQGIFLFEHRRRPHRRLLEVRIYEC
ncbi:MAG: secondary thiamine-phosphate synthase enzyme YjbQ [Planctomycetota bacterium]